jgi:hypothetical protein
MHHFFADILAPKNWNVIRNQLLILLLYKKCVRKMLMKLTPAGSKNYPKMLVKPTLIVDPIKLFCFTNKEIFLLMFSMVILLSTIFFIFNKYANLTAKIRK